MSHYQRGTSSRRLSCEDKDESTLRVTNLRPGVFMYRGTWPLCAVLLVLGLGMLGCTMMHHNGSSVTLPSSAYFTVEPAELKALQELARTQEAQAKTCLKVAVCEEALYLRGLVALFENRADAIAVFQELSTTMPTGRYAASSTRWLSLLQDSAPSSSYTRVLYAQLRQEVLHSLLDRTYPVVSRRAKETDRRLAGLNR